MPAGCLPANNQPTTAAIKRHPDEDDEKVLRRNVAEGGQTIERAAAGIGDGSDVTGHGPEHSAEETESAGRAGRKGAASRTARRPQRRLFLSPKPRPIGPPC